MTTWQILSRVQHRTTVLRLSISVSPVEENDEWVTICKISHILLNSHGTAEVTPRCWFYIRNQQLLTWAGVCWITVSQGGLMIWVMLACKVINAGFTQTSKFKSWAKRFNWNLTQERRQTSGSKTQRHNSAPPSLHWICWSMIHFWCTLPPKTVVFSQPNITLRTYTLTV